MGLDAVENARMRPSHRKLLVACCGGPLLDGHLLSIVGVALVGITEEMRLSTTSSALVGVVALLGMFLGGLLIGPLTDRVGRRTMYTIDLVVLLVASMLCAFVTEAWQLIVIGFALGADYPIVTALLAEWFPRAQRARAMGGVIAAWYIGAMLSHAVGWAILESTGSQGWRWVLGSAAVLSALVLAMRHGTPESPRWLVDRGRVEEAAELVRRVLGTGVSREDLLGARQAEVQRGGVRELFSGIYCGGSVRFDLPHLPGHSHVGHVLVRPEDARRLRPRLGEPEQPRVRADQRSAPARLPSGDATAGHGRQAQHDHLVVRADGGAAGCAGLVDERAGLRRDPLLLPVRVLREGPGILEWLYPNELFPTSIRASAIGVAVALSRVGAAVGTYLGPMSPEGLGTATTTYIGAGLTIVGLPACVAWAEGTEGKSLSEASGGGTSRPAEKIAAR